MNESRLARRLLEAPLAENTERAYASDWREFSTWCVVRGVEPLPASGATVRAYLAELGSDAGAKRSTIARRMAGINSVHTRAGFPKPGDDHEVRLLLRAQRRELGRGEELDQAEPLRVELLIRCVESLRGPAIRVARDRALLTLGFFGALRRSELVGVRVEHLRAVDAGAILTIPWSKTDQEARGSEIALRHTSTAAIDPIDAVERWRELSSIEEGPLLRGFWRDNTVRPTGMSGSSVNALLREMVTRAGVSVETAREISGHSLRAGFITSARAAGVPDHVIMRTTRHVDARTLNTYTRERDLFANAAFEAGW